LLKSLLKIFKLNESSISTILGIFVIVVVGVLVVNYFRNLDSGTTLPSGVSVSDEVTLPATHTVVRGETLWSISEKYYKTGYNWVDIVEENNLTSADDIAEGQTLVVPNVPARTSEVAEVATPEATAVAVATPQPSATPEIAPTTTKGGLTTSSSYTVVKGDTLWDIAVAQYGNGYKWVEIARANKLTSPDLIHPGNVFVLP